ncbi:tRNA N(3)-methylcytidine methyltransferase trm141-like isoform X1 [Cornus florida]|uniref:tRNA N(3)-methylcytidine methyltransferase trm141-like isoform X1 n=1 Tax=Cornus florida TaxID=4283 RepID=UPI00289A2AE0|nr:tRNA N(3)-methylcytidine methyltransferase trm141-like isoform X1 [Cornus florida]XP_059641555.1 tRNA N(3)-methylcytidine methyltransferase trm141-like isoform X1 [Cornus florida]XP_059641556.1 tRNA N(3)-methylcytidine methyltransferase trm141-like isoform X1 [Cornus florida]
MIYVYCWGVCGAVREMRAARLATISISPFSYCLNFFVGPFFIAGPRRHCSLSTTVRSLPLRIHDDHHHSPQNSAIKSWDKFYKRHQNKFFKDRHYLEKDWGQYFSDDNSESPNGKVVLEVGCGAGNTIFPLVAAYPKLFVHACDFSPQAITLVKSHVDFSEDRVDAFVCDVANNNLCDRIMPSSIDVVTLIFMLSAVCPEKMPLILLNIKKVLKPDGYVLLRDYALGDYAQVKLQNKNQMVSENFYIRGDGTCSFYFSEDSLSALFTRSGFNIIDMNIYCRQIENRSRNITMDRRWIRAICSLP